jgi:hypothetical protein
MMIQLGALDCFYILSIVFGFSFILFMEVQIKQIKTMMEEHIKFDCIEDHKKD